MTISLLLPVLVPAMPLPSRANLWVAWANKTGTTDFCLSSATATEPFKTCLIGFPEIISKDFVNWTSKTINCLNCTEANCSVQLIRALNHTLPWDPQEIDLLGSEQIGNATDNITTQTCFVFGKFSRFAAQAQVLSFLLGIDDRMNSNPYVNTSGWTDVSPSSKGFGVSPHCGNYNSSKTLSAYGWSMHKNTQDPLWNNDTAKALPPGYFLICGDRAWPGIPKNAFGGPCYLGKLTLLTVSRQNWLNITTIQKGRRKRSTHQLSADCDDNVELWSSTMNVFASLVPSVGTAQALAQLKKLACWSVKQGNATTEILTEMAHDMDSLRHAILQNRAAIDFLLLAQGHGCDDVDGMCCFNLSSHSNSIQKQLQWLRDRTKKISVNTNPFDSWLQSLFGGLSPLLVSLLKEGLRCLGVLIAIIVIVKIAYHCILNNVKNMNQRILLAQKEKGGIVGEWMLERGHGSREVLCESSLT